MEIRIQKDVACLTPKILSQLTDISPSNIRRYEEYGLIESEKCSSNQKNRYFRPSVVNFLLDIVELRKMGVSNQLIVNWHKRGIPTREMKKIAMGQVTAIAL